MLEFKVNPNILGGLQMYTETEFMDMSLTSRFDKLEQEIHKMVDWSLYYLNSLIISAI